MEKIFRNLSTKVHCRVGHSNMAKKYRLATILSHCLKLYAYQIDKEPDLT